MASSSLTSTLIAPTSKSPFCPKPIPKFTSQPIISSARSLWSAAAKPRTIGQQKRTHSVSSAIRALTMDFSGSFFERDFDDEDESISPLMPLMDPIDDREEPECPPGLRQYETMVILRPYMNEEERLALTQRYEEMLVAGGGMYVEVFNRGVIPLAYEAMTKDKDGKKAFFYDGIYLLFTYFTKPESIEVLTNALNKDDYVIRSSTFKVVKKKREEEEREKARQRAANAALNPSGSDDSEDEYDE